MPHYVHSDNKKKNQFKLLTHISAQASRLAFTKDLKKLQTGSVRETLTFKSGVSSAIVDCAALEWKRRVPAVACCLLALGASSLEHPWKGKDFDDAKAALALADSGLTDAS